MKKKIRQMIGDPALLALSMLACSTATLIVAFSVLLAIGKM